MTGYTPNANIGFPGLSDRGWDATYANAFNTIDALACVGGLVVTATENPSSTFNIRVTGGSFRSSNGRVVTYAGTSSLGLSASTTVYVWLTDAGVLTTGASWPAGLAFVPLAAVLTGPANVTGIIDSRVSVASVGPVALAVVSVSANYSATSADDVIRANASGGAVTVTLPPASSLPGKPFRVIKTDPSAFAVILSSSSNMNGSTTISLGSQYASKTLISNGATYDVF